MKRKALAITLAAVMAMGTCAVTASAADGDKYTIGICQLVQHDALDAATQGFKDEVIKELGEDAVAFDWAMQLPLMSRMHRAIPILVLQLLIALFPTMLT